MKPMQATAKQVVLRGISASPGLVAGPLQSLDIPSTLTDEAANGSPAEERRRFDQALTSSLEDLE